MENPYAWNTEKLLSEFMNACARTGISNSGLVISFSAETDHSRAHYLRGVVLSRIEGVRPPVQPGDQVQPKSEAITPSQSNGWKRSIHHKRALPDVLTVKTVHYFGNDRWELVFREENDATADTESEYDQDGGRSWYVPLRFKAEDFTQVKDEVPTSV